MLKYSCRANYPTGITLRELPYKWKILPVATSQRQFSLDIALKISYYNNATQKNIQAKNTDKTVFSFLHFA